jgi:hypothetical protein
MKKQDYERIFERLYEQRNSRHYLELKDFADLNLYSDTIGECLEDLASVGWAYAGLHRTNAEGSHVDSVAAQITPEGAEAFEESARVS